MWAAFRPDKVWRLSLFRDVEEVSESTIALACYIFSLASMLGPLIHDGRLCPHVPENENVYVKGFSQFAPV